MKKSRHQNIFIGTPIDWVSDDQFVFFGTAGMEEHGFKRSAVIRCTGEGGNQMHRGYFWLRLPPDLTESQIVHEKAGALIAVSLRELEKPQTIYTAVSEVEIKKFIGRAQVESAGFNIDRVHEVANGKRQTHGGYKWTMCK